MMAFRLPGSNSPEFATVQVLADVLDSERAKLYDLVTEGRALSVDFSISTFPDTGIGYVTAAFPKGADAENLIAEVQKILTDYTRLQPN